MKCSYCNSPSVNSISFTTHDYCSCVDRYFVQHTFLCGGCIGVEESSIQIIVECPIKRYEDSLYPDD